MSGYLFQVYQNFGIDVLPTIRVEIFPLLFCVGWLGRRHCLVTLVRQRLREGVIVVRSFFRLLDGPEHEVYGSVGAIVRRRL